MPSQEPRSSKHRLPGRVSVANEGMSRTGDRGSQIRDPGPSVVRKPKTKMPRKYAEVRGNCPRRSGVRSGS